MSMTTPLYLRHVQRDRHKEIVKVLIEKETLLEASNVELQTLLPVSARSGHFSIVRVFIHAGTCVDV